MKDRYSYSWAYKTWSDYKVSHHQAVSLYKEVTHRKDSDFIARLRIPRFAKAWYQFKRLINTIESDLVDPRYTTLPPADQREYAKSQIEYFRLLTKSQV